MTTPTPLHPEIRLRNTPPGLTAYAVQRTLPIPEGRRTVLQAGLRLRTELVDLRPATTPAPDQLTSCPHLARPGDRSFVLGAATRTWSAISDRYRDQAWTTAVDLARAGAVVLRCHVTDGLALGTPKNWSRTEAAHHEAQRHQTQTDTRNQDLHIRAGRALCDLQDYTRAHTQTPGRAAPPPAALHALRLALEHEQHQSAPAAKRTLILAALAHDLAQGVVHANARSFSLAHTGASKTWDDALAILQNTGIPRSLTQAVGLYRSSRIGIGGPITACLAHRAVPLHLLQGPVLIRADQSALSLHLDGTRLVVVENLQAAETLCDTLADHPGTADVGILYSAGMPSRAALHHIATMAASTTRTVIAPDADLGGTRIATTIWNALTPATRTSVRLCDVGTVPHTSQRPWAPDSAVWPELRAALTGPAAALARGCLERGYPVEQEACIVEAVLNHL